MGTKKRYIHRNFPCFAFHIEIPVTLSVFSMALAKHYFSNLENLPDEISLSKTEAEKILRQRLRMHGTEGDIPEGDFETSFELGEQYRAVYEPVKAWVAANYPWLATKPQGE